MTLPAAVQYGQVYWTGIGATADGPDIDGTPDPVGVTGTVTFTASPRDPLTANPGTDAAVSVFPMPSTYSIVDGVLKDSQGRAMVSLIATTATAVTPVGWTWSATYRLNAIGGSTPSRGSFSFTLGPGQVLNLANAMPVASSNGVPIIQGPVGPQGPPGPGSVTVADLEDPTSDAAVAVEALAAAAVAPRLVPTGGTGGQTLTKNSDIDGDAAWFDRTSLTQDASGNVFVTFPSTVWAPPDTGTIDGS